MTCVYNSTKRKFYLNSNTDERTVIQAVLVPGFNEVDEKIWNEFSNEKGRLAEKLISSRQLQYGDDIELKALEEEFDNRIRTKKVSIPQARFVEKQ